MINNKKDFKAENIKDLEAQKMNIDDSTKITDDLEGNNLLQFSFIVFSETMTSFVSDCNTLLIIF
ncbi:hypothetical protein HERIO_2487 [Hepatospora eriocheir]|uniref:Uncharacterized protein n=1 Tax=Hepatospora eriocheir TaxID=1081669 RepID=A0A1X0Q6U1_9MICR|nr:hypothetical protein HERIO_2487 [Hepatospora eriocheir]